LIGAFSGELLRNVTREMLRDFLDEKAKSVGRSVVDHLRFRLRAIFQLALAEGRPGEILALRVRDVDLVEECVYVRQRVYRGRLGDPKSDRSKRQLALTKGTMMILQMWMEQACSRNPDAWVFSSENGKPLRRDNVWTRNIRPKLEPIGLGWATFQVMRRSHATWSKKVAVDAHTRSAQMGNTVDVNENEYAVATFDKKLAAVRLMETAILQ
jgi:integrase